MGARAFRLTMIEPSEAQVLGGVKLLLERHPAVAWALRVNSGKGFLIRNPEIVKRLLAQGLLQREEVVWMEFGAPGLSDTIWQLKAHFGGTFGAIEVKKPSGRVRDEQAAFLERVNTCGGIAGIARSVDGAQAIVERGVREVKTRRLEPF